ncbi:phosphoenolpyruvate--protein phosphotransferase [Iodidimonas sp. SYSU 1G8]|uniref:phosphoenolpyruvate--protein phosphotransferase n=1 Tax=Iodidimonas sp. SYSU 1G8 TaxID=3133967 RepID=UPI0031FEA66A
MAPTPVNPAGPRLLLRRMREVMASPQPPQEKLDQMVRVIANNMVAEVCSIYLVRAGDILELFATVGLKAEAVHKTNLRVGEGLIGEIAARGAPLNLADAQSHPNFAYRPETGEDIYHSLMGVPVIRGGRVLGVLAVQNVTQRLYTEEETEALQTVAMVLAELVGSGELIDPSEVHEGTFAQGHPPKIDGVTMAEGIAIGQVVLHEPRVQVTRLIAEDEAIELVRLDEALSSLRSSLDNLLERADLGIEGDHFDVLETYRMFANDRGWVEKIRDGIRGGLTAEAAVQRVQVDNRVRMAKINDPYLRERLSDLDDLANRLIRHLMGLDQGGVIDLPEQTVVVARNLGPTELLDYDRARLRGVILAEGTPSAHVAIIAKALGIPVIGQVEGIVGLVDPGDQIIVDAMTAQVFLLPTQDVVDLYEEALALRERRRAAYAEHRDLPAITKDGVEIGLHMNAGLLVDLPHLSDTGAHGIGLFRTEFQFMVGSTFPRHEAQRELYSRVLDAAGDKPVVFRTLDIGSDKVVPFLERPKEENPALGWRAIRMGLDRPALLRYQLRALLAATAGRDLRVMFPLVSDVSEFLAARSILEKELKRHVRVGREPPGRLWVGTMLEVPALAWQLDALIPHVDFVSIGSNDLMQYLFAADRGNTMLTDRYDILSPAALSFLRMIVDTLQRGGVSVSLCGEAAGKTVEAMALIGIGLRSLSMTPASVGPVKEMIRTLDVAKLRSYLLTLLPLPDHSLRTKLTNFARDHGVEL